MKTKVVEDADVVTYVVVCDPGDEAFSSLVEFARGEKLAAAQITAVGAFQRAAVGWFDPATKQYRRIEIDEQCRVAVARRRHRRRRRRPKRARGRRPRVI